MHEQTNAVPYGYCKCGCGERAVVATRTDRGKGWVQGEPRHFAASHLQPRGRQTYMVDPDSGCWMWQGRFNRNGYPQLSANGVAHQAHRYYYAQAKGPIPEGLVIDHLCSVPACVNPDHLEAVTTLENIHRSRVTKLTWEIVREVRTSPESSAALARRYGVSYSCIYAVRTHARWPEADRPVAP